MKKIISYIIILLLVVGCSNNGLKESNNVPTPPKIENVKKEDKLSLLMVGDALIHDAVYKDAHIGNNKYNFKSMFEEIAPIVKKHDLAFYNQETIIGGKELGLSSYPRFNTPEELSDELLNIGFNVVALANNHSLDKNEIGILNSNNYWKTKDVLVNGTANSIEDKNNIIIKEKNNIKYTMLSYTLTTNGLPVPTGKDYLLNVYSDELVSSDVNSIKDKVDVIMISMHWGNEYVHSPNAEQLRIANYLSSLGVDIVIGHHPHVVQPITFIDDTLVIYSLGNFISAQQGLQKLVGMMVSVDITKVTENNKKTIAVSNVESELIYTYYDNFKNFKVIPYRNLTNDIFNSYEDKLKPFVQVVNEYDNTIKVNGE